LTETNTSSCITALHGIKNQCSDQCNYKYKFTHSALSCLLNSSKVTISWSTIWSAGDAVVYEKSKDEVGSKIFFNDLHWQSTKAKESSISTELLN